MDSYRDFGFGFADFDNLVERQAEQFNQHVGASANFHKYLLDILYHEHVTRAHDNQSHHEPPMRIRTVEPSQPMRPIRVVSSTLGQAGKRLARKVLPSSKGHCQVTADQPCIIEGEFRVIEDDHNNLDLPEVTITINQNPIPKEK